MSLYSLNWIYQMLAKGSLSFNKKTSYKKYIISLIVCSWSISSNIWCLTRTYNCDCFFVVFINDIGIHINYLIYTNDMKLFFMSWIKSDYDKIQQNLVLICNWVLQQEINSQYYTSSIRPEVWNYLSIITFLRA